MTLRVFPGNTMKIDCTYCIKASFSFHKLIQKKHANDYLIY